MLYLDVRHAREESATIPRVLAGYFGAEFCSLKLKSSSLTMFGLGTEWSYQLGSWLELMGWVKAG